MLVYLKCKESQHKAEFTFYGEIVKNQYVSTLLILNIICASTYLCTVYRPGSREVPGSMPGYATLVLLLFP